MLPVFYRRYYNYTAKLGSVLRAYPYQDGDETVKDCLVAILADLKSTIGEEWDDFVKKAEEHRNFKETPAQLVTAKVTYANPATDKRFGFLAGSSGKREDNIFFHFDRGLIVKCDGSNYPVDDGNQKPDCPKYGDILVYSENTTRKGKVAEWWCFASNWDDALQAIATRRAYRLSRVLGAVCWEGQDLAKLRLFYPKTWHEKGTSSDMSLYLFEKKIGNDWVKCEDPR